MLRTARLKLLIPFLFAVVLGACGGAVNAPVGTGGASPPPGSPAPSPSGPPAPTGVTLTVTQPKEGDTLPAGDVTVAYDISGVPLASPAAASGSGGYHLALLLDVDATPYLQQFKPLPSSDPKVLETADTRGTFKGVQTGDHTVYVMLVTADHVAVSPPKFYKVTFKAQ